MLCFQLLRLMQSPYDTKTEFTIEPGCPWYEAQQTYGAPNVNWCEPTQCSWISEPANTWSNLAYILVAVALIGKLRKSPGSWFPLIIFLMGALSFIYHASNNYLSQILDFVGMFLMMSFLLAFNFQRLFGSKRIFFSWYWFFMFLNTLAFLLFDLFDQPVQKLMLYNAVPALALEAVNGVMERSLRSYRYLVVAFLLLIIAQAAAIADIQRIYCAPNNVFLHGHVIWHLVSAGAMYFIGLHIKEIQLLTREVNL